MADATPTPSTVTSALTSNAPVIAIALIPSTLELSAVVNAPAFVAGYPPAGQAMVATGIGPEVLINRLPSPLTSALTINAPGYDQVPYPGIPDTLALGLTLNAVQVFMSGVAAFPDTFEITAKLMNDVSVEGDVKTVLTNTIEHDLILKASGAGPTPRPQTLTLSGTALKEGSGSKLYPPFGLNVLKTFQAFDHLESQDDVNLAWDHGSITGGAYDINYTLYNSTWTPEDGWVYTVRKSCFVYSDPQFAFRGKFCTKFELYYYDPQGFNSARYFNLLMPFEKRVTS